MTDTPKPPRRRPPRIEVPPMPEAVKRGRRMMRGIYERAAQPDIDSVGFVIAIRTGMGQARDQLGPHGPVAARETLDTVIRLTDEWLQAKRSEV